MVLLPLGAINSVAMYSSSSLLGLVFGISALSLKMCSDVWKITQEENFIDISKLKMWDTENAAVAIGIAVFSFKIMSVSIVVRTGMEK